MSYACYCDWESPTLYKAVVHCSRRERRCEECGKRILPGDRYERADGLYEGHWFSCFTCELCCELRQWVKNNLPCFCWAHASMIDDAVEAVQAARERAPEEMRGVTFGFLRRLWRVRRRPRPSPLPSVAL